MSTSKTYNGHKNWNHWNVSLWINNTESFYRLAQNYVLECKHKGYTKDDAALAILKHLNADGYTHTPDGAEYNKTNIRAAIVGL